MKKFINIEIDETDIGLPNRFIAKRQQFNIRATVEGPHGGPFGISTDNPVTAMEFIKGLVEMEQQQ